MFGPTLDAAIGIAFIFFMFSSMLTIIMEMIAGFYKLRAKALEDAIARLIADPAGARAAANAVIKAANVNAGISARLFGLSSPSKTLTGEIDAAKKANQPAPKLAALFDQVSSHPLLRGAHGDDAPSYVAAANFSAVLAQALSDGAGSLQAIQSGVKNLPEGSLKTALSTIVNQANQTADGFRVGVETWFDAAMDRLSGDYKRFTQVITFTIGLALAFAFNVDALRVAQRLYSEPAVRASLEAAATSAANQTQTGGGAPSSPAASASNTTSAPSVSVQADRLNQQLAALSASETSLWQVGPVGWDRPLLKMPTIAQAIGWFITALAGLLGAPFWFGALNSFVNIRYAGPKPTSSTSSGR